MWICFCVNVPRFVTVAVDIGEEDVVLTETVLDVIIQHQAEIRESIVRTQLSFSKKRESLFRDSEIYKAGKEAYYVTVVKEIKGESRSVLDD